MVGEQRLVHVRHELPDLAGAAMDEAEASPGIAGIAAIFGFRRLLQHHDAFGAGLARGDRRLEGRAAAADHHDVASLAARHEIYSPLIPAKAMYSFTTRGATWDRLSRDQFVQLGAAERAADRQAAFVGLGAIFLVVHQPQIGRAKDLQPLFGNAGRTEQRQSDVARCGDKAKQRARVRIVHHVGQQRHAGKDVGGLHHGP